MNALLEPLRYDFMWRALGASLIVGLLCAVLGVYVVLRRLALIGDGVAHASFAGVVIAYLRGVEYQLGAAVVAILVALGVVQIQKRSRVSADTAIGVLFTGAFALGVFLISRSRKVTIDLQDFLFGNVLAVSPADLRLDVLFALAVAVTLALLWRPLLYASFDPVVARAAGVPVDLADTALLVMLALTVVIAISSIGIILVAALLVTPAATALLLTRRFAPALLAAVATSTFSCVAGLYISYYAGAASGATIVLLVTLAFFAALGVRRLRGA